MMEELAATLMDSQMTDGLILLDRFMRIKKCNPQAEVILHHPLDALLGKHISELFPTEFATSCQSGNPLTTRVETESGDLLLMYEPVALPDLAGVIILRCACQEEQLASEVETLHESVHSLSDIVGDLPVEIFVTDTEGNTLSIDACCEELYGVPATVLLGRNVRDLEEEGFFSPALTPIVVKAKKAVTVVQETKTGKKIMATANPVFDKDGNIVVVVTTSRDVTSFFHLKRQLSEVEEMIKRCTTVLKQDPGSADRVIVQSPAMQRLMSTLNRIAPFDSTVLFLGESGTGKDTLARLLHRLSSRKTGPFVKVNCGAIPETLMESEFFGYVSGAFTGAQKCGKKGLVEMAHRGTLFLDEVDSLSLQLQAKLLHVIQERQFMPVGGTTNLFVDVRFMAATNKDLEALVADGRFREDLYYRLNVVPVKIPPLRERREEIVALATFFLDRLSRQYGIEKKLDLSGIDALTRYDWPGNVRELENVIERCVVISSSPTVNGRNVMDSLGVPSRPLPPIEESEAAPFTATLGAKVADVEKAILVEALRKYGSTRKVAAHLGVNQSTVVRKMKRFGLMPSDRDPSEG